MQEASEYQFYPLSVLVNPYFYNDLVDVISQLLTATAGLPSNQALMLNVRTSALVSIGAATSKSL